MVGTKGIYLPFQYNGSKGRRSYLNCMRGPDGKEYWSTGVVKEFIPEKKLVITDSFSDPKRK